MNAYSYEEARRHGNIEWEAYVHFGVDQNGCVPRYDLYEWVRYSYGEETASSVFPLEESLTHLPETAKDTGPGEPATRCGRTLDSVSLVPYGEQPTCPKCKG